MPSGIPGLVQPSSQCSLGDVAVHPAPDPERIDEGAFRGVDADRSPAPRRELFAADVEGERIELVQMDGGTELGPGAAAGKGDVDDRGSLVGQLMPRER